MLDDRQGAGQAGGTEPMYDPLLAAAINQAERERQLAGVDHHGRLAARPSRLTAIAGRLLRRERPAPVEAAHDSWRMSVDACA